MVIAQAVATAGQVPPEIVESLGPFADVLGSIISTASWLLGGVFGLYLILILVRIYYERRQIKILSEIRKDLRYMREKDSLDQAGENYLVVTPSKVPKKANGKQKK